MRRLSIAVIAVISTVALTQIAVAADIPVKAPIAPVTAPYNWTGFYAGANVGYSWGRSNNDWDIFARDLGGGGPLCAPAPGFAFCATGSDSNKLNGAIGGLQAGYNWQRGNYLIGIETDIQVSGQKGDGIFSDVYGTNIFFGNAPVTGTATAAYTEKLSWLGTLRGRVGFAADRWLLYATGGLAYGRVKIDGSATADGLVGGVRSLVPLASFGNSVTKAGWTIGAGAEGVITGNWSWKVEYLHVDLGTVSTTFATLPGCYGGFGAGGGGCTGYLAGSGTIRSRITDEIVRVGINYRFGPGPVAAN